MLPFAPASVAYLRPLAALPPSALSRLGTKIRQLSDALVTIERYLPEISAHKAPTGAQLQRMCDEVCSSLDEMLVNTWHARAVHDTVQSIRELIAQLGEIDAPQWPTSRPVAHLTLRLEELARINTVTGPYPAIKSQDDVCTRQPLADHYVHRFPELKLVRRQTCLTSAAAPHKAAPAHALGHRCWGLSLSHLDMVLTESPLDISKSRMLQAVDHNSRLHTVHAIPFAAPKQVAALDYDLEATTLEGAYHTLGVTQFLRTAIEEAPAFGHPVWHNLLPRLGNFAWQKSEYRLVDAALCLTSKRLFFATNHKTGTLEDLHRVLPYSDRMRQALVWSVAAQCYVQLARMHTHARYGHFNLSTASIAFDGHGALDLMGFDKAAALDAKPAHRPLFVGCIAAPEMVEQNRAPKQGIELDPKLDVFALASIIAEVAGPGSDRPNPFAVPADPVTGDQVADGAYAAMSYRFKLFTRWKMSMRSHENDTVSCAAIAADTSPMGLFFAPLARVAPELCDILLNDAMADHGWQRTDAMTTARRVLDRCTLPHVGYHGQGMLIDAMKRLDAEADAPTLKKEAQAYRAWQHHLAGTPEAGPEHQGAKPAVGA